VILAFICKKANPQGHKNAQRPEQMRPTKYFILIKVRRLGGFGVKNERVLTLLSSFERIFFSTIFITSHAS